MLNNVSPSQEGRDAMEATNPLWPMAWGGKTWEARQLMAIATDNQAESLLDSQVVLDHLLEARRNVWRQRQKEGAPVEWTIEFEQLFNPAVHGLGWAVAPAERELTEVEELHLEIDRLQQALERVTGHLEMVTARARECVSPHPLLGEAEAFVAEAKKACTGA